MQCFQMAATCAVVIGLACVDATLAKVILQADFDSPSAAVTHGGSGKIVAYSNNTATIEANKPLGPNTGGYLSVVATHDSKRGLAGGARITPASSKHAFSALSTVEGGTLRLQGAIAFLFRSSKDVAPGMNVIRAFSVGNTRQGELRLIFQSYNGKPRFELFAPEGTRRFVLPNGNLSAVLAQDAGLIMEADTVYHLALAFETDEQGQVTASMYAAEGAIPISRDDALATKRFGVDATGLLPRFPSGAFFLGKIGQAGTPTQQDFDCFRLYDDVPDIFDFGTPEARDTQREPTPL